MHRILGVQDGPIKEQLKELKGNITRAFDWHVNWGRLFRSTRRFIKARVPIVNWLPHYTREDAFGDLMAGTTVALLVIPESLAFANLAGLPLEYAIYASYIGCFIYVFLGTSCHVTVGPTAIMSLMTGQVLGDYNIPAEEKGPRAVLLCLIMGIFQIAMGILHFGFFTKFISVATIGGFTSAAALIICFSQLGHILGLEHVRRPIYFAIYDICKKIGHTRWPDLLLGALCIAALVGMRTILNKHGHKNKVLWLVCTSRNSIIIIITCLISYIIAKTLPGWKYETGPLTLMGELKSGLPKPEAPPLTASAFEELALGGFVLALMGYLESLAIAKTFAKQTKKFRINATQELFALGMCSIFGSFFHSYPTTGSFSRTAVNAMSGAKTPLNNVITGSIVIVAAFTLTTAFGYIPESAIAAIIVASVMTKIDINMFIYLWRVNVWDLVVFLFAFCATLFFGIEYGILIGTGANIVIRLYRTSRPAIAVLGRIDMPPFYVPLADNLEAERPEGILIFQLQESLIFSNWSYVRKAVFKIERGILKKSLSADSLDLNALGIETDDIQIGHEPDDAVYRPNDYQTLRDEVEQDDNERQGGTLSNGPPEPVTETPPEFGAPEHPQRKHKSSGRQFFSDVKVQLGLKQAKKKKPRRRRQQQPSNGLQLPTIVVHGDSDTESRTGDAHSIASGSGVGPESSASSAVPMQTIGTSRGDASIEDMLRDENTAIGGGRPKLVVSQDDDAASTYSEAVSGVSDGVSGVSDGSAHSSLHHGDAGRGEIIRAFIFDMSCVHDIDSAGIEALREILADWNARNVVMCIAGAKTNVLNMLQNVHYLKETGTIYFFKTVELAVGGVENLSADSAVQGGEILESKDNRAIHHMTIKDFLD